ncbi:MAG: aspartate kinase [Holosporales bacterium]|jgi:aspartate kinase|nr:aspartate kinase [Holosporales bacterium]
MSLIVLKFGGSSVGTASRFENVASIIEGHIGAGRRVAVVVSAMQGMTNQLVDLTKNFTKTSIGRENDAVVSAGEQISSGLLALALKKRGIEARSFQGWQIPITTESVFGESRISYIRKDLLVDQSYVPVISGFQGVSESGDITTLGRGGSDATAVAVAHVIEADECLIYTDVDGVYTADPRLVLNAEKLRSISYNEMLELAINGAKVLQAASVDIAKSYRVKLRVLSSFAADQNCGGTIITNETEYITPIKIAGITHNSSCFSFNLSSSHEPIVEKLSSQNIAVTHIADSLYYANKLHKYEILEAIDGQNSNVDNDIGIINIVGIGAMDISDDVVKMLLTSDVVVKNTFNSDLSFSIVVPFQQAELAINILHAMLFSAL